MCLQSGFDLGKEGYTGRLRELSFTPEDSMHLFAFGVAVRGQGDGTVASISGSTLTMTSEMTREERGGGRGALEFEASTLTTAGLANPLISIAEDILVVFTTVISLLLPVLGALIFVVLAVLVVRGLLTLGKRRQARRVAAAATAMPPTTYSGYR